MAKKHEVMYYNGHLKGSLLSDEDCQKLDALLELDAKKGFVSDLKHVIYDLTPAEVDQILIQNDNSGVDLQVGTLENTQTIGVAYMYFAKRLVLGDSVGMGKTVQVCGLCNLLEAEMLKNQMEFRFLYLTGKNLVNQARNEFIKFTGNYVQAVQGVKDSVSKFCKSNWDYLSASVVGSHSLIKSKDFQEYMIHCYRDEGYNPFDILIIDEAGDILANSGTQMYKEAQNLAKMFDRVILLNATSFEKELQMFYNQIKFVDGTFLPTKTEFDKEYMIYTYGVGPYPQFSGKYKNAEKFRNLVRYRYLARTRKSAGATMTNCTAEVLVSPLSKEQKYMLSRVSMPNMVYDCPSYFQMGIPSNMSTTPKLCTLVSLLQGRLKNEKSILIYARYKEAQSVIESFLTELGYSCAVMNGDSPINVRNDIINKFKLGDIPILITNVQKGLNFGNCNHCIFYSYDTNPNRMVQFEGRMTRSYNIDNKHVYLLISRGDELKAFKSVVADRAKASDVFAGSDFSCVLSILLDGDTIANLK
jgi:superfamily II DNA or RNA helicase